MTKVDYMVEYLKINNITNKAEIVFKRCPTQEDIKIYNKKIEENESNQEQSNVKFFGPKEMMNFFHLNNYADKEMDLNLNRIVMSLSLADAQNEKLTIGNIVVLVYKRSSVPSSSKPVS